MASIGTHYILSALGGARKRGLDCQSLLRLAQIPENQLTNPKARFDVERVAILYGGIATALNDEFMGFTKNPIKSGTFALMSEWASHASNLEDLLRRGIRFYNQITDELKMSLEIKDDHVYFTTEFRRPELDFEHFYTEYWHVIWHRFGCWYIDEPIKLVGAYINYQPLDPDEFSLLFRCPTYLKSHVNRLVFHKNYLHKPLVKTPRDLQNFLARLPVDLLTIPGEDTSLSAKVNQLIEPKKADKILRLKFPKSADISAKLGMSEQTLRRRLAAEGTSYQNLKDDLRYNLANKWLLDRSLSIADISLKLGYSEPRVFSRAYQQWSGQQPKQFRLEHLEQQEQNDKTSANVSDFVHNRIKKLSDK